MAEGDGAPVSISYPEPPSFYKLYHEDDGVSPLPPLPPPPVPGKLIVFGRVIDPDEALVPPLQATQLYHANPDGSVDFTGELQRLSRELRLLFLELLRSLVEAPGQHQAHLNTINTVMKNMQHLLNCLRPHQARATLEYALKLQVQDKEAAVARLRTQLAAADEALLAAARAVGQAAAAPGPATEAEQEPMAVDG